MKKGFLTSSKKSPKCSHITKNTKNTKNSKCMRPISSSDERNNSRGDGSKLCKYHLDILSDAEAEKKKDEGFNDKCPICLEGDIGTESKLFPLPCSHRGHLDCFSGMTKLECPICRASIDNLPKDIQEKIEDNAAQYGEEIQEENERAFIEMIERERARPRHLGPIDLTTTRIPPHMEIILALKYIFQLGIPVSCIPRETIVELDPLSPLPASGSIFQNTVRRILTNIRNNFGIDDGTVSEDGDYADEQELVLGEDSDGNDDFRLEGEDLQIVHRVRTIPSRFTMELPDATTILRAVAGLFATMSFNLINIPDITQEDLINLGMGEYIDVNTETEE